MGWTKEQQKECETNWRVRNREHVNEQARKYYRTHKKEHRNRALKYNFGIDLQDYSILFNKQQGCCAICGRHQSLFKRVLSVDHSHKTGSIRGLLCQHCNHQLGWYENLKCQIENYLKNS